MPGTVPRISVGWIPGIKIDVTFLYGHFFISDYWNWLSKSCWFWGYKKFDPIPWEFGFENFAQNLKLCGLRPYAWAFYSQSHPKRSTFYAGHFHTLNKGYLFDFTSTHAISTPVKSIFSTVFRSYLFSASDGGHEIGIKM